MGTIISALVQIAMARFIDDQSIIRFSEKPAFLLVKQNNATGPGVVRRSLPSLLRARCPSLFRPFKPIWWLANGHYQTMYCILGNFSTEAQVLYHRTYLRLHDGGTLGLDFAPCDQSTIRHNAPIVIVQHGLTGGSYEPYVKAILSRVCAPVGEGGLGYRAVVINFRGCAGVPLTSPLMYSAGHTDDTRQALRYIAHQYPDAPILGVGFSLGANVLTRYLGEEGELSRVHAACVLGCPWDLKLNSEGLSKSFSGRHVYSKAMARNLMRLLRRHVHSLIQIPDHEVTKACKQALELNNPSLSKFDDTFTRIAGGPSPIFPFRNVEEYYIWASSDRILNQITVPFLAINAGDDPVVKYVPMDGGGNGLVVMALTKGGGHLGWFQSSSDGQVERWSTEPVLEWLKLMGQDVVHGNERRGDAIFVDGEGFIREKRNEHLGCRKFEGGGVTDGHGGEDGTLQGL